LSGRSCPKCSKSQGEATVERILNLLNIKYKSEVIFTSKNRKFRIDFVINYNNQTYFVEYNGSQHYIPAEYFGGKEHLQKQQIRDQQLRIFVQQNNFHLLELRYT